MACATITAKLEHVDGKYVITLSGTGQRTEHFAYDSEAEADSRIENALVEAYRLQRDGVIRAIHMSVTTVAGF